MWSCQKSVKHLQRIKLHAGDKHTPQPPNPACHDSEAVRSVGPASGSIRSCDGYRELLYDAAD
eukprot:5760942-Amphidinium_carterae.1